LADIRTLKQQLYNAEKTIDDLCLSKQADGVSLLNLEDIKANNDRMVRLLKSTKEVAVM
jgi:hypothetical protein